LGTAQIRCPGSIRRIIRHRCSFSRLFRELSIALQFGISHQPRLKEPRFFIIDRSFSMMTTMTTVMVMIMMAMIMMAMMTTTIPPITQMSMFSTITPFV